MTDSMYRPSYLQNPYPLRVHSVLPRHFSTPQDVVLIPTINSIPLVNDLHPVDEPLHQ